MRVFVTGWRAASLPLLLLATSSIADAQATPEPASPLALLQKVDIPYQSFTLPNGLRVYVVTDRKAPVIAVSVWYNVGSKNEPSGKTGYAHLFEHLMFSGSENAPGSYIERAQKLGATSLNGSTAFDRTNYFETVPTPALDGLLYLESDRMGHLLGALSQERLDNQRGVVQNEKRQHENNNYGMVPYAEFDTLYPPGHPYSHTPIGSMADLDAASIDDMRSWFRGHYGPNNAVLVMAGDIDVTAAKAKVQKFFGDIPRGPDVVSVSVPVPTLSVRKDEVLKDRVASTQIRRVWAIPGQADRDAPLLEVGADILGGLESARLNRILVKDEQLATMATADADFLAQGGQFEVTVTVKEGVDPNLVAERLDAILAGYIKDGPTVEEIRRAAMTKVTGNIMGLDTALSKSLTLGEGALYWNDPDFYKKELQAYAAATPVSVTEAMRKWLTRPVYALTIVPGERVAYVEAKPPAKAAQPATPITIAKRAPMPDAGTVAGAKYPPIERTRLSNGVQIVYAQRLGIPVTTMSLTFDAGSAADLSAKLGLQRLLTAVMKEGTAELNGNQITERQEQLGASIDFAISSDRTSIELTTLSDNLGASLDLTADITLNPALRPQDIERLRNIQMAAIEQTKTAPAGTASRTLMPTLFGSSYPYGRPGSTGYPGTVKTITRNDLVAFQKAWLRPEKAKIFVVSDEPLDRIRTLLEAHFGKWTGEGPAGIKNFAIAIPPAKPRIILIDRKDSPQSFILGGQVIPLKGTTDHVMLNEANSVLGDGLTSRIGADLRETKGWSYGAYGSLIDNVESSVYAVSAPVQADKTGASIVALRDQVSAFLTTKGVTAEELARTKDNDIRSLSGMFEQASTLLVVMRQNDVFQRPDNYYNTLGDRLGSMTAADLDTSARSMIKAGRFVWIVVGDVAVIKPQLRFVGLPIEISKPQ